MSHLQGFAGLLQFDGQRIFGRGGGSLRSARFARGSGRGDIVKHHEHPAAQRRGFFETLNGHIDALHPAIGAHLQAVEVNRLRLPQRFAYRPGQRLAQPGPGHGVKVDIDPAGCRLEVFAGASADVDDVAVTIDQHRGGGVVLLDYLVCQQFQASRGDRGVRQVASGGRGCGARLGKSTRTGGRGGVLRR